MKTFYVTFGMGSILRGYYAIFQAADRDIVAAYLNRKIGQRFSNITERVPIHGEKPLRDDPEVLCYSDASHI